MFNNNGLPLPQWLLDGIMAGVGVGDPSNPGIGNGPPRDPVTGAPIDPATGLPVPVTGVSSGDRPGANGPIGAGGGMYGGYGGPMPNAPYDGFGGSRYGSLGEMFPNGGRGFMNTVIGKGLPIFKK